jgi:hypothetical protein
MLEADYLRRQAETCSNLSRATFDLGIAGRLRALAEELLRKAAEIEREDYIRSRENRPCSSGGGRNSSR